MRLGKDAAGGGLKYKECRTPTQETAAPLETLIDTKVRAVSCWGVIDIC